MRSGALSEGFRTFGTTPASKRYCRQYFTGSVTKVPCAREVETMWVSLLLAFFGFAALFLARAQGTMATAPSRLLPSAADLPPAFRHRGANFFL
jgi:hypothetical protein